MKRIILIILALALAFTLFSCNKQEKPTEPTEPPKSAYELACERILASEYDPASGSVMSDDIADAIANEKFTEAKNYIFMIGDGMGNNCLDLCEVMYADKLPGGKLAMRSLPVYSSITTFSASTYLTDSAAGGTALATGWKTTNGMVGMNRSNEPIKNNLERAAGKGKSTGVIATTSITDATPAAFSAHVQGRGEQEKIAGQQLEKLTDGSLDLALGGGWNYFEHEQNAEKLAAAKEAGVTYSTSWDEISAAPLPLLGAFAEDKLATKECTSLAVMTDFALDKLDDNEEGFFLMVEGSQIDKGGHANDIAYEEEEVYNFDCAVAVAMRYVALHPDTMLIITADHETGGLTVPQDLSAENASEAAYAVTGHSEFKVPLFAAGYGVEALEGITDNTDVAHFVAEAIGDTENYGVKNEVSEPLDLTDAEIIKALDEANADTPHEIKDGVITFTVTGEGQYLDLPLKLMGAPQDTTRLVHVTIKNISDHTVPAPSMFYTYKNKHPAELACHVQYIKPGQSVQASYALPDFYWNHQIESITLTGLGSHTTTEDTFEVSDIRYSTREPKK